MLEILRIPRGWRVLDFELSARRAPRVRRPLAMINVSSGIHVWREALWCDETVLEHLDGAATRASGEAFTLLREADVAARRARHIGLRPFECQSDVRRIR